MTRNEFYPCQQTLCKFYEEWKIKPELGSIFVGMKSNVSAVNNVLICLICKHFLRKSNLTSK